MIDADYDEVLLENAMFSFPAWDGVSRVDAFLTTWGGVPDSALAREASRGWLLSLAARIATPGVAVSRALCLAGPQGSGKTSLLQALGGARFRALHPTESCDEVARVTSEAWVVEVPELGHFAKLQVLERFDYRRGRGRGRGPEASPRGCVLVATCSELPRAEMTRRFWRVETRGVDAAGARKVRDQVISEALTRFSRGERE